MALSRDGDLLRVEVRDDGAGFDPGAAREGAGTRGMRERAELLGGSLRVEASPGRGVVVRAEIPCAQYPAAATL